MYLNLMENIRYWFMYLIIQCHFIRKIIMDWYNEKVIIRLETQLQKFEIALSSYRENAKNAGYFLCKNFKVHIQYNKKTLSRLPSCFLIFFLLLLTHLILHDVDILLLGEELELVQEDAQLRGRNETAPLLVHLLSYRFMLITNKASNM